MIIKFIKNFAILGVAGFIGYKLYKRYQEANTMVSDTVEKINIGVQEATEFLKSKNQELEEKIKEKKGIK